MTMNIRLDEAELQHLTTTNLQDFKFTAMPVKNITTDISECVTEQSAETIYLFITPTGNMVFKKINDQFQVSSVTGDDKLTVFLAFCQIAEQNNINYTSLGFELFS